MTNPLSALSCSAKASTAMPGLRILPTALPSVTTSSYERTFGWKEGRTAGVVVSFEDFKGEVHVREGWLPVSRCTATGPTYSVK